MRIRAKIGGKKPSPGQCVHIFYSSVGLKYIFEYRFTTDLVANSITGLQLIGDNTSFQMATLIGLMKKASQHQRYIVEAMPDIEVSTIDATTGVGERRGKVSRYSCIRELIIIMFAQLVLVDFRKPTVMLHSN